MAAHLQRSLINGVAWTSAGTWVNKVIGIAYSIIVLSHLSVYEYGVTELLLSIPALLAFMNLPGLETVVMADMAVENSKQNKQKAKFIFTSYLSARLALAVVTWAAVFFSASIIEAHYNQAIATMVQVLSFSLLFGPIRTAYQILFRVNLNFNVLALHKVTEEMIKLVVVVVAFYVFDLGPLGVIVGYVAADVAALPVFAPFFVKQWQHNYSGVKDVSGWFQPLYNLKAHGKWGIFSSYVNMFSQNIRPWIIKVTLGTHAVGIYAAAMGIYQNTASLIPVSQVVAPVMPQFVTKLKTLCSLTNAVLKYQLLAYILSGLAMLAFLPFLIEWFFPDFNEAYVLFSCLLFAMLPSAFSSTFETVFVALKAQRDLFWANVAILLSVVLILPISIYAFGLLGIAVEFFLTRFVYAFGRYRKLRQLVPEYAFEPRELYTVTDKDQLIIRTILRPMKRFTQR